MLKYRLNQEADAISIEFSYLYLLGREAESYTVVNEHLQNKRTIQQLITDTTTSAEYQAKFDLKNQSINYYISLQRTYNNFNEVLSDECDRSITLLQTADAIKYAKILQHSKFYNIQYAKQYGLNYHSFMGVKKGYHPHHATFNRIYLLDEMIQQGATGWVVYIDADAIITDRNFDLHSKLSNLREREKCFWLHNVHPRDSSNFKWWDINAGVFAIDLGSNIARNVIKTWKGIYNIFYTTQEFIQATKWTDILDDQQSLWRVLEIFNLESKVELEQFQHFFVHQALRSDHDGISSDEEMQHRINNLIIKGNDIWQEINIEY